MRWKRVRSFCKTLVGRIPAGNAEISPSMRRGSDDDPTLTTPTRSREDPLPVKAAIAASRSCSILMYTTGGGRMIRCQCSIGANASILDNPSIRHKGY